TCLIRCLLLSPYVSPPAPSSTLSPYTTLFRSQLQVDLPGREAGGVEHGRGAVHLGDVGDIRVRLGQAARVVGDPPLAAWPSRTRSEEHTSELQSLRHLVCRLLLEKKNRKHTRD